MTPKLKTLLIIAVFITLGFYGIADGQIVKKRAIGEAALKGGAPVFIEGFVIFNLHKNKINSNITIREGHRSGRLINNARITFGNSSLKEGSTGNYTGTSNINFKGKATGAMGRIQGVSRLRGSGQGRINNNNINLFITTPNRRGVTISENFTSGIKITVSPVYRTGIDVGEPLKVSWNRNVRNQKPVELLITNDRGLLILHKKNLRGNTFIIPAKKLPPRRTVNIFVRIYEKNLVLNGNVASGSIVKLYSEGSFQAGTHK